MRLLALSKKAGLACTQIGLWINQTPVRVSNGYSTSALEIMIRLSRRVRVLYFPNVCLRPCNTEGFRQIIAPQSSALPQE